MLLCLSLGTSSLAAALPPFVRQELQGAPKPFYYDAEHPLEAGDARPVAVVIVHGWGDGVTTPREAIAFRSAAARRPEGAPYVVAPHFPRVETMKRKGLEPDGRATWNESWGKNLGEPGLAADDWRGGGDAKDTAFSSYDVIDKIFAMLGDVTRYPNLRRVVLAGYSAGGQFVGRYAAVGKGMVRPGVTLEYAAMAPSSELRLLPETRWHYGLKGRPRYSADLTEEQIRQNLASRRVWRGCGVLDVKGRPHTSLDSCAEAMAQGTNRYDRFCSFQKYLREKEPAWAKQVSFHSFENLSHRSPVAYADDAFVDFALGQSRLPDVARDCLQAAPLSACRVQGPIGAKMDRFAFERGWGPFARGVVMREAEEAFAHPDDDVFNAPIGMWKGEFWGKLALSGAAIADMRNDADYRDFLHTSARRLIAHQRADGYLGTYIDDAFVCPVDPEVCRRETGYPSTWNWNLWCRKYTLWGLLAVYRLTGDRELLAAAARAMTQEIALLKRLNLRLADTGTSAMRGLPPTSTLKPLMILYRETGTREYLDFARETLASFRDATSRAPQLFAKLATGESMDKWYPGETGQWGKAYEMMSLLDGMVEYYRLTGEREWLDLVVGLQDLIWRTERNPVESVGYNDQFTGAARHLNGTSEPCDAVHWIRLNYDLYLATGDAKYVDAAESTYYNAFLAGVFRDGKWGAREVRSHGRHIARFGQSGMRWQHCCVDNLARTFADIAQLAATREGDAVRVNLYSPFTTDFADATVSLTGDFPVADKVKAHIRADANLTVRFRVPPWSPKTIFRVGDKVTEVPASARWHTVKVKAGHTLVRITFDLAPRLVDGTQEPYAGKEDYRYRRWNAGPDSARLYRTEPAARLFRGPLLLAKSKNVGTAADDILKTCLRGGGWQVKLRPLADDRVHGAWEATFTRGNEVRKVNVCDFPSAGDELLPPNADYFSIFF